MAKVYDAMGNFTGVDDPATDTPEPSPQIAKPADESVPDPKGGPIVVAGQIKLGKWIIYGEGEKLFAKSPEGKKLQFVLFDPTGITETLLPNKLSDGSDRSKGNSIGNTAVTGRTVPGSDSGAGGGASAPAAPTNPSRPLAGPNDLGQKTTEFKATDQLGRDEAEKYLGRKMTDEEWNNLVAATFSESGRNAEEQAWIMGTILNRTRQTGGTVMDTLNQQNQFPTVTGTAANPDSSTSFKTGPAKDVEASINGSAVDFLPKVPESNYYFNNADPAAVPAGESVVTQRSGVQGVLVGQSYVYPGAKWP